MSAFDLGIGAEILTREDPVGKGWTDLDLDPKILRIKDFGEPNMNFPHF